MTDVKTHTKIDRSLSGEPISLGEGSATVKLRTTPTMAADDKGLVHGGFLFSAADYTAMLCVNHPNVVLGSAQVRFLRPVKVGDEVIFRGEIREREGKRITVLVEGERGGDKVFEGTFICILPDKHVLT